jgi:hypothetical protein
MCLAQPAIHAMGEGYDVYVVTEASGGVSPAAHDMAIRKHAGCDARVRHWRRRPRSAWRIVRLTVFCAHSPKASVFELC